MSDRRSSLPLAVQDLEAKERYSSLKRSLTNRRICFRGRYGRALLCIGILFVATIGLVVHLGDPSLITAYSIEALRQGGDKAMIEDQGAAIAALGADGLPVAIDNEMHTESKTLRAELTVLIHNHRIIVFSKTYCPYSRQAKNILNEYHLKEQFYIVEVDLRSDAQQVKEELTDMTGRSTFPNIFVNGQTLGGASELATLHQSGELQKILAVNNLLQE